jgi:hypothetical protein
MLAVAQLGTPSPLWISLIVVASLAASLIIYHWGARALRGSEVRTESGRGGVRSLQSDDRPAVSALALGHGTVTVVADARQLLASFASATRFKSSAHASTK